MKKEKLELYIEARNINEVIAKIKENFDEDFSKKITQIKQVWKVVYYGP